MEFGVLIRKNTYYDSVTLMLISKEIKKLNGVKEALVGMGTDLNKELATNLNISKDEIKELGPNDFFITILAESNELMKGAIEKVDELLSENTKISNLEERKAIIAEADAIVTEDQPSTFLYYVEGHLAYSPKLHGPLFNAANTYYKVHEWYIE